MDSVEATTKVIERMAAAMEENRKYLTKLDSEIGDGDHGNNMRRGFAAALERLRALAQSACKGIESARAWLTTLTEITGGLDIYDRGGRQRVSTELGGKDRRF